MASTLVWFDIPVVDLERGKAFYAELFGWEYSRYLGPLTHYWLILVDGEEIGAIYPDANVTRTQAAPVMYFHVPKVDEALAKAERMGGRIFTPKSGIAGGTQGYYAAFQDPDGNLIGLWGKA